MTNAVNIAGRIAKQLSVSAAVAGSGVLEPGTYDVWCDIDVWVTVNRATPSPVLSATNGYKVFTGNIIPVRVSFGDQIWAIAGSAGTLNYEQTN